jgi:hypothetical protein
MQQRILGSLKAKRDADDAEQGRIKRIGMITFSQIRFILGTQSLRGYRSIRHGGQFPTGRHVER